MKEVVQKQYREHITRVRHQLKDLTMPSEGWLRTARKALGMSGAQLARRLGVTRAMVSNTERAEQDGGVTLKTLQNMAQAMDCRLVYAIIPEQEIEAILQARAYKKAREQVMAAGVQMALEAQTLSQDKLDEQVQRLARDILEKRGSQLWNEQ
ncbi:MAG: mobile mystery protein A [Candidatus Thiodiazotropha sp.]